MKQPAAILVLPVLYTILVLQVFYQNLPVSAILVQILVILVSQYLPASAILEDTGHCQNMCIADTAGCFIISEDFFLVKCNGCDKHKAPLARGHIFPPK
jgi:hypothetical protein